MSYFIVEKAANGMYIIKINFDKVGIIFTTGSFNIAAARVANLSYPDYLKWCRDHYNAEIIGKGSYYCLPYFKNKKDAEEVASILNLRVKFRRS